MTAAVGGKVFGVLSLAAVGMATTALVVGVMIFTGAAGIHGITGSSGASGSTGATGATGPQGPAGASGANGANGASGANGANGVNGSSGTADTWGTLSLSFTLGGSATDLTLEGATCPNEGHGAYACLLTVKNTGNTTGKVTGLSYAQNAALYYGGGDPTIGSIFLTPGATTQFTLWFQAVAYSGSTSASITVIVEPDSTSS